MEAMRDVLRGALQESLAVMSPLDRLAIAWPVAAGHSIALRSQVEAFENGVVVVVAESQEWLQQLRAMAPRLREELQRVAGVPLRTIHFEQKL